MSTAIKIDNLLNNFFRLSLKDIDQELYDSVKEFIRQQNHIELIASENIVSKAVLEAQGSVLTNKYAEGYPGKDTTVVVNTLIFLKIWLLKERKII